MAVLDEGPTGSADELDPGPGVQYSNARRATCLWWRTAWAAMPAAGRPAPWPSIPLKISSSNPLKWFFHFKGDEGNDLLAEFQEALAQADARMFEEASRHPRAARDGHHVYPGLQPGTRTCLWFTPGTADAICFAVGMLYRVTRDHTMVQEMVNQGYLGEKEVAHTKCGTSSPTRGRQQARGESGVPQASPRCGRRAAPVLRWADGNGRRRGNRQYPSGGSQSAKRLPATSIDRANELGGKDNVTVIVARFEE